MLTSKLCLSGLIATALLYGGISPAKAVPIAVPSPETQQTQSGSMEDVGLIDPTDYSLGATSSGRRAPRLPDVMPIPDIGATGLLFPLVTAAPITSPFGWRIHPISGERRMHSGTDLGAAMGTPVVASITGRVVTAGSMGGYGLTIVIEQPDQMRQILYGHLSEILVQPGTVVQAGTVIGRVGSTGASTGPHLHFEMRDRQQGQWIAQDAGFPLAQALQQIQRVGGAIAQQR
jgi:murein DD-endopeptidase MepM/ murein hydrolase activator NlpD